MTTIRGGLIQMGLKAPTDKSPADIAKAMIDAHIPFEPGCQMVCGGRADTRRTDGRPHARICKKVRDGNRRPRL